MTYAVMRAFIEACLRELRENESHIGGFSEEAVASAIAAIAECEQWLACTPADDGDEHEHVRSGFYGLSETCSLLHIGRIA